MADIKNVVFYAFFKPAYELGPVRDAIDYRMLELGIKGTILLAFEGINCSIAGCIAKMDDFLEFLFEIIGIPRPDLKISYSHQVPFMRSLVKIKPRIVANPGPTPIDITENSAPYLSPEEFQQWIGENRKMVVLDTRNDFEHQAGRFRGSIHLGNRHFSGFEEVLQGAPQAWQSSVVVTFCTGGIRCEKAAPLMIKKGFREVYQLDGGILNYFKKFGRGHFEGECFVFDGRISL